MTCRRNSVNLSVDKSERGALDRLQEFQNDCSLPLEAFDAVQETSIDSLQEGHELRLRHTPEVIG